MYIQPFCCTDATADNYDATATVDDGSCIYTILGCTDSTATNYDATAYSRRWFMYVSWLLWQIYISLNLLKSSNNKYF